jgi:hypothetical protein
MFAMQVNVERLPYGLFRSLGADKKLLGYFIITVSLSIGISAVPLFEKEISVSRSMLLGFWGTVLVIFMFLSAYRRALLLINPLKQIQLMVSTAEKSLKVWQRRGDKLSPLIENQDEQNEEVDEFSNRSKDDCDMGRVEFFKLNPHWSMEAEVAVQYAISISRTYAARGDHQIAEAALNAIVKVHKKYITARGRTFFKTNFFIENPLSNEPFLTKTLEQLRQNIFVSISRGDEQQIIQTYRSFTGLVYAYSDADYGKGYGELFPPVLAAGYLASAVKATIPHKLPDVLMEGARQMALVARPVIASTDQDTKASILDELQNLAIVGIAGNEYRAVTLTCLEQLAELQFDLLRSGKSTKRAIIQIRDGVFFFSELFLETPDAPLSSPHQAYLAPYFSSQISNSFLAKMHELTNALINLENPDGASQVVIANLLAFSDDAYAGAKKLLLKSVKKQSALTFDLVHWIAGISKLLNAVASCPAGEESRDDLLKASTWLFGTLTWLPNDEDSVRHVRNWSIYSALTNTIFDACVRLDAQDVEDFLKVLSNWIFKSAVVDRNYFVDCLLAFVVVGSIGEGKFLKYACNLVHSSIDKLQLSKDDRQRISVLLQQHISEAQSNQLLMDYVKVEIGKLPAQSVKVAGDSLVEVILGDAQPKDKA